MQLPGTIRVPVTLNKLGNSPGEAIKAPDKAIEIDPQNDEAWSNKGNSLHKLGKLSEAIKSFDKAIEINPQNPTPWYNKGNTLNELNEPIEAIKSFDKAVEIDPHTPMHGPIEAMLS